MERHSDAVKLAAEKLSDRLNIDFSEAAQMVKVRNAISITNDIISYYYIRLGLMASVNLKMNKIIHLCIHIHIHIHSRRD